jgi:hypothetical protein
MLDRSEAADLLEQLRSQVATVQTSQIPKWRSDIIEAINLIFGGDSAEEREFQSIRFSPSDPAMVRVERFARHVEVLIQVGDLPPSIDVVWERFLRERLQEAEEFLVAIIAELRQRDN